ncbi:hypothetical protein GDO81_006575 [Engystomops pustulosus]|uniref:Uncharacterized protein n=1 Tax=Engystomops pustulosus TaxID=76066 RepID=A0AAV7CZ27_ENGPU|nr:hypothetical protein GDO81_006575 [Engystomops pustulosus]
MKSESKQESSSFNFTLKMGISICRFWKLVRDLYEKMSTVQGSSSSSLYEITFSKDHDMEKQFYEVGKQE